MENPKLLTRKQAKQAGNKTYSKGKLCAKCGGTERYTSSGQCIACHASWTKAYSKANKDKINAHNRERWKTNHARKERQLKWQQDNRDKCREACRQWAKKNPERARAKANLRRTLKLQACPVWVDRKEIEQIYKKASEKTLQTGLDYHVDHIVPLNNELVCGLHVPWNLQIITAEENIRKGNKLIDRS